MNYELSQKALAWLIFTSGIMGYIAGLVYEFFRFRRGLIRFGKVFEMILVTLEDLLFFLVWGSAFCILLFVGSFGVVRVEAILAQGAGFFLYRNTLGRLSNKILEKLSAFFQKHVRLRQRLAKVATKALHKLKKNKKPKKLKVKKEGKP